MTSSGFFSFRNVGSAKYAHDIAPVLHIMRCWLHPCGAGQHRGVFTPNFNGSPPYRSLPSAFMVHTINAGVISVQVGAVNPRHAASERQRLFIIIVMIQTLTGTMRERERESDQDLCFVLETQFCFNLFKNTTLKAKGMKCSANES